MEITKKQFKKFINTEKIIFVDGEYENNVINPDIKISEDWFFNKLKKSIEKAHLN